MKHTLFALAAVALAAAVSLADEPQLRYVKKATRQETMDASLEASGLPRVASPWFYVGPFDNSDGAGFAAAYPPEKEIDLGKSYAGRGGQPVRWHEAPQFSDGAVNNLNLYPENEFTCIYLRREIPAESAADVGVSLGSDDTLTVWLNGKKVLEREVTRAAEPDQDRLVLHLKPGKNQLLLKVCNLGGPSAFYFRTTLPPQLEAELRRRLDSDFPRAAAADPENKSYRIVTLPIPEDIVLEVGGLAFRPDGKLLACTRRGDIYAISNPDSEDPARIAYSTFATGLHEPLGLLADGNDVFVVQRPELSRLRDSDGDGLADDFTTICDRWGVSGDYHEFAFGPARDRDGNFFITLNVGFGGGHQSKAPWRGWCVRVAPDGELTPWASGLRSPNGVQISPDGDLFYCDNQGEWVAACKLSQIRRGEFHGHPAGLRWDPQRRDLRIPANQRYDALDPSIPLTLPAVWFPYGKLSQSASEPRWDTTGGKFGPFTGQCFVGDQTKANIMRVFLEKVNGQYQGACFPFRSGFRCGINRLVFGPDGSLYAGMTNRGWGSVGGYPYGLERLVFTGVVPLEIHSVELSRSGFDLTFTKPLDVATAERTAAYSVQSYTYHYWSTYGSPELDRQPVAIDHVTVSEDARRVSLAVTGLKKGHVYEIHLDGVRSETGEVVLHPEAYYTLNELRE